MTIRLGDMTGIRYPGKTRINSELHKSLVSMPGSLARGVIMGLRIVGNETYG